MSTCVVIESPLPLVVVTVRSASDPSALRSLTVSVRLPSALRTVTSVRVSQNVPEPYLSCWIVVDSPLALVVVTLRSFSDPLAL